MKNILVTGVGGGVGQSILKALAGSLYAVVAIDAEELAAGLYGVAKGYMGYYARDPRFIERLVEVCEKESCGLIFAGHDVELMPLAASVDLFKSRNICPVVSSPEVIRICDDKLATYQFLRAHGIAVPDTRPVLESDHFTGPAVLKPQHGGARSRGTYVIRSVADWDRCRQLVNPENCVVQEYIDGDEYTCGSVNLGGECRGVIVMRRTLRDGDTYKAFVEFNPSIEAVVRAVVAALKPFGACNVQLRVRDGQPIVFEINARCSGTTAARALAGFNEPRMIADYLLQNCEPTYAIREISILRYWNELAVSNDRIAALRQHGVVDGDGTFL